MTGQDQIVMILKAILKWVAHIKKKESGGFYFLMAIRLASKVHKRSCLG